ncbi:branched-chain amino acid aminotransferase 2, chloroplastic-like protein [Tanacetum coccineum]
MNTGLDEKTPVLLGVIDKPIFIRSQIRCTTYVHAFSFCCSFYEAVKATVLANERWIPPPGKGSLYIMPLLMGSGSVLDLAPAPEYAFLIYVSPVGNYFKVEFRRISLIGFRSCASRSQTGASQSRQSTE